MGTVVVSRVNLGSRGVNGGDYGIPASSVLGTTESLSTATSAATTGSATGLQGEMWAVTPKNTQVWVKFGAAPTAAANDEHFLGDIGRTYYFQTVNGDKCAALDNV